MSSAKRTVRVRSTLSRDSVGAGDAAVDVGDDVAGVDQLQVEPAPLERRSRRGSRARDGPLARQLSAATCMVTCVNGITQPLSVHVSTQVRCTRRSRR